MTSTKYSIHRCLIELKTIGARIDKTISTGTYIGCKKESSQKVYNTILNENEFKNSITANIQSIESLIIRARKIKDLVINSNAVTTIDIAGEKITIAAAIERKKSIDKDKLYLKHLKRQYNEIVQTIDDKNSLMEETLNNQIYAMIGGDKSKINSDEVLSYSKSFREANTWKEIDPIDIKSKIDCLEKYIETFESEVDYKLSTSNAITEVDIQD